MWQRWQNGTAVSRAGSIPPSLLLWTCARYPSPNTTYPNGTAGGDRAGVRSGIEKEHTVIWPICPHLDCSGPLHSWRRGRVSGRRARTAGQECVFRDQHGDKWQVPCTRQREWACDVASSWRRLCVLTDLFRWSLFTLLSQRRRVASNNITAQKFDNNYQILWMSSRIQKRKAFLFSRTCWQFLLFVLSQVGTLADVTFSFG